MNSWVLSDCASIPCLPKRETCSLFWIVRLAYLLQTTICVFPFFFQNKYKISHYFFLKKKQKHHFNIPILWRFFYSLDPFYSIVIRKKFKIAAVIVPYIFFFWFEMFYVNSQFIERVLIDAIIYEFLFVVVRIFDYFRWLVFWFVEYWIKIKTKLIVQVRTFETCHEKLLHFVYRKKKIIYLVFCVFI